MNSLLAAVNNIHIVVFFCISKSSTPIVNFVIFMLPMDFLGGSKPLDFLCIVNKYV